MSATFVTDSNNKKNTDQFWFCKSKNGPNKFLFEMTDYNCNRVESSRRPIDKLAFMVILWENINESETN